MLNEEIVNAPRISIIELFASTTDEALFNTLEFARINVALLTVVVPV